ncbi:hypothetical protein K9N50_07655 [bacterium]|nr:hypothetical protein [bacterium]
MGGLLLLMSIFMISAAFKGMEGVGKVIFNMFMSIGYFGGGTLFYYHASRAPRWLIDARNRKVRAGKMMQTLGWNFVAKLAQSDRTYKVKWSDGSTTTETEYGGTLMTLIIMITYFAINTMLVPFRAAFNYYRNYIKYSV